MGGGGVGGQDGSGVPQLGVDNDPHAPSPRKPVLISFRTGKTIEIPDSDIVIAFYNFSSYCFLVLLFFDCCSWVNADLLENLKS